MAGSYPAPLELHHCMILMQPPPLRVLWLAGVSLCFPVVMALNSCRLLFTGGYINAMAYPLTALRLIAWPERTYPMPWDSVFNVQIDLSLFSKALSLIPIFYVKKGVFFQKNFCIFFSARRIESLIAFLLRCSFLAIWWKSRLSYSFRDS